MAPFLSRSQMEITRVESGNAAVERAARRRFDLAIVVLPVPGLDARSLIQGLRSVDDDHRQLQFILLTDGHAADKAGVGDLPGVEVLAVDSADGVLRRAVAEALGVKARLDVRIPIRLEVGIEAGRTFRFCETRNISRSGILISSSRPLPVDSEFQFELILPNMLAPLMGSAVVVRQTDSDLEGTIGFAARFLELSGADDVRIESFIQNALPRA